MIHQHFNVFAVIGIIVAHVASNIFGSYLIFTFLTHKVVSHLDMIHQHFNVFAGIGIIVAQVAPNIFQGC